MLLKSSRDVLNKGKALWIVLFIGYCGVVVWMTLFNRSVIEREFRTELFWAFRRLVRGEPGGNQVFVQYLNNIVLFIPFGFLFGLVSRKKCFIVISIAAITSASIEMTQYITAIGLAEIDDVISNTLGAFMGFLIYKCGEKAVVRHK